MIPKKKVFKILKLQSFYHIASIFDMYINIKERVDVNQDWPSLIIEAPPHPPGPQIAKDVNVFSVKNLLSIFFLCCTYISSVMRLIISRGAEGPGREILQCPPVCLSVRHV